jgi:hypothetical protein
LKKKERCEYDDEDDGDFLADSSIVREKSKKHSGVRKRKFAVTSDSDFLSNGSSDYDYTISEEERELVREANQFGELKTSLRSSSAGKRFQENGDLCEQTKPLGRKGKEKVEEVKSELGRQVCGICLSEEDKRRFRGTLDCCSHYFCFTCIMEWSKVESRCPLCKQRFRTITKNGRSIVGVDLRNMVIQVPKRDQVVFCLIALCLLFPLFFDFCLFCVLVWVILLYRSINQLRKKSGATLIHMRT